MKVPLRLPGLNPLENREIHEQLGRKYEAGFVTDIESDSLPPGLNEDVIRAHPPTAAHFNLFSDEWQKRQPR